MCGGSKVNNQGRAPNGALKGGGGHLKEIAHGGSPDMPGVDGSS